MNSDPFAAVRPQTQQPQQPQQNSAEADPFAKVRASLPQEESLYQSILRNVTRLGVRGVETALGAPGNLIQAIDSFNPNTPPPENEGFSEKIDRSVRDFARKALLKVPASKDIKQFTSFLGGDYLEPQEDIEKSLDEITETTVSFALPGSGPFRMMKNIGVPIFGQAVKEGIKFFGGEEKAQEIGKMTSMLGLSMGNITNARRYAGNAIQASEQLVPQQAIMTVRPTQTAFNNIRRNVRIGDVEGTWRRGVLDRMDRFDANVQFGSKGVRDALTFKKDVNAEIGRLGGFDVPRSDRAAIPYLRRMARGIDESLEHYGRRNPQFLQSNREANQAWGVVDQTERMSNFIQKEYGKPILSTAAKVLFGTSVGAGGISAAALIPAVAVGGLGTGLYQSAKVLEQIARSPVLRRHYTNVMTQASRENAASMIKSLSKLDEELLKDENQ